MKAMNKNHTGVFVCGPLTKRQWKALLQAVMDWQRANRVTLTWQAFTANMSKAEAEAVLDSIKPPLPHAALLLVPDDADYKSHWPASYGVKEVGVDHES